MIRPSHLILTGLLAFSAATGQDRPAMPPPVNSPELLADRRIVFRLLAPKAQAVTVSAGDMPALARAAGQMVKGANDVWEVTVGPADPGTYRYRFMVDGVAVVDPRNPLVSESNTNAWSVVHVPGSDFMDAKEVPHGTVSEVFYHSKALGRLRRMHVYTPPGYELGKGKFPVFYLLHGASDSDDSWTSVGRAGFILDNLIAAKKAKPMLVVMPHGHTSTGQTPRTAIGTPDEFARDFTGDVMPYIESHYRVINKRASRAIAGLSMGGGQTLNITMGGDLGKFAYIGVYSSGVLTFGPRPAGAAPAAARTISPDWEKAYLATLDNASLKKDLKLLWFATGSDDFLLGTTKATVELLKKHGFNPEFKETSGGHTWINWHLYLNEFAPKLF